MNRLEISFDGCEVPLQEIMSLAGQCMPVIERVIQARTTGYESEYASINLPFDERLVSDVNSLVSVLLSHNPALLIVVGIGGSNLGAKAMTQAVLGACIHQNTMKIFYVDTVDPDSIKPVLEQAEITLKSGCSIILTIITKSGTTTETIANGTIFIELLKKYDPEHYHKNIVVITDLGTKLDQVAHDQGWHLLHVPPQVGGRYSVFSAVGLFPMAMMGIDIRALLSSAADMVSLCLERDVHINCAARSAALLYALYKRGFIIHNLFAFSVDLYELGLWYRQLVAESLGKEYTLSGEQVFTGITPLVSIGSTDLHSIVELHLGGPNNTFTTFVGVKRNHCTLSVPTFEPLAEVASHIQGRELSTIMGAIFDGTKFAYSVAHRPFMTVSLSDKSGPAIAQFMQWKMFEVMYLGYLLNIDPFVQPQVELYKKKTRELLARV